MNDKNLAAASLSPTWMSSLCYEIGWHLSAVMMTIGFSMRASGTLNMPRSGPVLVISNHQSFLDPLILGIALRRHLVYLARKTLFRNRLFARIITTLNAVPIDQEGVGKEGIKTIVEQLGQQRAVLVFPEGERTPNGKMLPLRPGIHLLIRRAESLIVPVGIAGAYEAYPRTRALPVPAPLFLPANGGTVAACIGKPLPSSMFAQAPREQVLSRLFDEIAAMQRQAEALRRK